MTYTYFAAQMLNGLQFGVMLFLLAAGLTLIFGIMGFINLTHGSFYMLGAYVGTTAQKATGSFAAAVTAAVASVLALGLMLEWKALRPLYRRSHLDQVLATFGLLLFFNEAVRVVWGSMSQFMSPPVAWAEQVEVLPGMPYPSYRLLVTGVGIAVAGAMYLLINRTRIGMLIRAGASDRHMVAALGVDIDRLYTLVFGLGVALSALAGVMAGPILSVEVGMGEAVLILAFVVVVIGGVGSVKGAFLAALAVGLTDTLGRAFLPMALEQFLTASQVSSIAPALASMVVYILMSVVLLARPAGLTGKE